MGYTRHGSLGRVYEWEGGTLVLNPGEFTFDEPHVDMSQDPPGYARGTSCMYRPDLQKRSCRSPARLLAMDHGDAPLVVKDKCDALDVNAGYCCPPYAVPRNWRVDFLPMGQEDAMPDFSDQEYMSEVQIYEADARLAAGQLQEAPEAFTTEAQEVYDYIVKYGNIAATEVGTAAVNVGQQAQKAAINVAEAATPVVEDTRTGIRKHPLMAVGIGIIAGAIVARWLSRR
jgi:hypothetical protein